MTKIVFLDFDGVVIQSFEIALATHQKFDPEMTAERYKELFKGNINEYASNERGKKIMADFYAAYTPLVKAIPKVPNIGKVLPKLWIKYIIAIISSSETIAIQNSLYEDWLHVFVEEILGNDVAKSKIIKMQMLFKKYQVAPTDCIFITDTVGDIREAAKAGVESIGVSWGFHHKEWLQQEHPFSIVDHPKDLISAIEKYFDRA